MPRPKGYVESQETKDKRAQTVARRLALSEGSPEPKVIQGARPTPVAGARDTPSNKIGYPVTKPKRQTCGYCADTRSGPDCKRTNTNLYCK